MESKSIEFSADKCWTKKLVMNNGLEVPQFGYGCYLIRKPEPFYWALKYGYRHIDSAAFYGNEKELGNGVRKAMSDFNIKREEIFITTKIPPWSMGYEKTLEQVQTSLTNLDLGYIDLMLIHHPGTQGIKHADKKNIQSRHDSWRALEECVEKGIIKSIGISNFWPKHIDQLLEVAKIKPVINQFELHPMYVEYETIEACKKHEILVEAYSPLAKFDDQLIKNKTIVKVSQRTGIDVPKVILLYLLTKGFIIIPKSEKEERIASNNQLQGLELSDDDIKEIDELGKNHSLKVCWESGDVA